MQITDTIKNVELPNVDFPSINLEQFDNYRTKATNLFEQFGRTAANTYGDSSDRVMDVVIDTNNKVVDIIVSNATKMTAAIEPMIADTPLVDWLPAPAELGEVYLDVVDRVVGFNRDLSNKVVDLAPATKPAPKKVSAKKVSAKKVSAKKTAA